MDVTDKPCASPWEIDYDASGFGPHSVKCGFFRNFTHPESLTIYLNEPLAFRTGFNVFEREYSDTVEAYGFSDLIKL